MASFRILDRLRVFYNLDGTAPASGGRVDFFEAGTTTPKAVYQDPELTISNGASIELDAAGRLLLDCWGDGSYRVRQYAADGSQIGEMDDVQVPGGAAQAIPTPLEAGFFLSNDGALLLWDEIRQPPDPTGQANKFLKTDGTNFIWETVTIPTPATPDIVVAAASFRAGTSSNTSKFFIQRGTGQAPATTQRQSNVSVAFPTAFTTLWHVGVTVTSAALTSSGVIAVHAVPTSDVNGFSVQFDTNDFGNNNSRFINPIPFTWIAYGLLTVP